MKFSIRDMLWAATVIALTAALIIRAQQESARANGMLENLHEMKNELAWQKMVAEQEYSRSQRIEKKAESVLQNHRREIRQLRQLIKQSINDQRDWFELQVKQNRIVAIRSATTDSRAITANTVRKVERATGFDGKRMRHFLEPIPSLRPTNNRIH